MRAVRFHEHGGPDVLGVDEIGRPEAGHGELRIDVRAASVNPVDTYYRTGDYTPADLPWIPGTDFAGVVDAVGEGVEGFEAGDRVFGGNLGGARPGSYAETITAPAASAALLPDGVGFVEAAAVVTVGATAWRALVSHADLDPAETCLIHGGSGGVGHVAVQLADAVGARVVTTARPQYHDRLGDLGADAVIDYDLEDLETPIREAGAPDVILDHRLDDYLSLDAAVAATGCRVVGIGNERSAATLEGVADARGQEVSLQLMSLFNAPNYAEILEGLATLLTAGDVAPDVARVFDLEDAADAQRAVMEDSFFGKLVLEP